MTHTVIVDDNKTKESTKLFDVCGNLYSQNCFDLFRIRFNAIGCELLAKEVGFFDSSLAFARVDIKSLCL